MLLVDVLQVKFVGFWGTFLALLDLLQQKTIRADGLFYYLLLFLSWEHRRDGNQPVLIVVVFLPVLWVDPILQNHLVALAILLRSEGFGIRDSFIDVRGRINPSAIGLTWTRLLNKSKIYIYYIIKYWYVKYRPNMEIGQKEHWSVLKGEQLLPRCGINTFMCHNNGHAMGKYSDRNK